MDTLTLILSIIGCANWGLVGLFQFDLVAWLFGGSSSLLSRPGIHPRGVTVKNSGSSHGNCRCSFEL